MPQREVNVQSIVPSENQHPRTGWSPWMRSPWLACFERRDICFLFLVIACIFWFRGPLEVVFTGSLHDEHSEHFSHISLIPFLCLYLLYLRRAAIFATVE